MTRLSHFRVVGNPHPFPADIHAAPAPRAPIVRPYHHIPGSHHLQAFPIPSPRSLSRERTRSGLPAASRRLLKSRSGVPRPALGAARAPAPDPAPDQLTGRYLDARDLMYAHHSPQMTASQQMI
jgi:hypothetical protein